MKQRPKVGEILVKAGIIDEMQLRAALGDQSNWGGRLGVTLVKMGLVEERDLVRALAQQLHIPVVQLDGKRVQQEVLDLVPGDVAEKHSCVPLFVKDQNGIKTLYVGMDDPGNLEAIDDLSFRAGLRVEPVLVSPSELCEAIDRFYHRSAHAREMQEQDEAPNAVSMDGRVPKGAAAQRTSAAERKSADEGENAHVHESLFREVVELEDSQDEPEIPDTFGPLPGEEASASSASPPSDQQSDDPGRTILHALCQLLIERGVIDSADLTARVRKLEEV